MIKTLHETYPGDFKWKNSPYEYVYDRNPFDVIAGTDKLRQSIEQGINLEEIKNSWENDLSEFQNKREQYLLYT